MRKQGKAKSWNCVSFAFKAAGTVLCASLVLCSDMALAQSNNYWATPSTTQSTSTTTAGKEAVKTPSIFSGNVAYEYDQSSVDYHDGSLTQSQMAQITENARLGNWVASLSAGFSQDLRDSAAIVGNGMTDTTLSLSHKPTPLTSYLSLQISAFEVIPTSHYSRDQINLQSALGADYALTVSPYWMPKAVTLTGSIGGTRNFHAYDQDTAGNVLNPWSLREMIYVGYQWGKFYFDLDFIHRSAWSYNDDITEDFEHSEEGSYSFTKAVSLTLGHSNRGPWLGANGIDSNLKLFNDNTSVFYTMLNWKY